MEAGSSRKCLACCALTETGFFPYRTDTAVEHGPWGTLGLIAANVGVSVWLGFAGYTAGGSVPADAWALRYGEFDPVTWVTSAFVHASAFHVAGNMAFLWTFGLVVEGSIGWRRCLPVYFAIIIVQAAVEQILMLGADGGGSVGASGGTSGLMAIAALWAPRTHVYVYVWVWRFVRTLEVTVLGFCTFWLGLQAFALLLRGFAISSELLHLVGAFVGLGIGKLMLEKGWVECDGWDYVSLRAHGPPRVRRFAFASDASDSRIREADALVNIRDALQAGAVVGADDTAERAWLAIPGFALPKKDLERLIQGLIAGERPDRAAPRLEEFLKRYPQESVAMRLSLAAVLVRDRRPSRALEHLEGLDTGRLTTEQRSEKVRLAAQARAVLDSGGLELE